MRITHKLLFLSSIITSSIIACSAHSQTARELAPHKRTNLPKLYTISLGKTWADITKYQPTAIDLAGKAKEGKGCGKDTYFTITLDFDNALAYADLDTALEQFDKQAMSLKVRQMFYPNGEAYEFAPPVRGAFANTEALASGYQITFSDGRRYLMRHYTTFASGYYVHVNTYNLRRDDKKAAPCFAELFTQIAFHKVKAK